MDTNALEIAAAKLVLDSIRPEDLPDVAVTCIQQGIESKSIIWLAGLSRDEMHEAKPLFESGLSDVGLSMPSKWDAVRRLAREEAKAVLDDRITAFLMEPNASIN